MARTPATFLVEPDPRWPSGSGVLGARWDNEHVVWFETFTSESDLKWWLGERNGHITSTEGETRRVVAELTAGEIKTEPRDWWGKG